MSTYTPIASQTLSAGTTSVTFSGIPQTYTDLRLVISFVGVSGCNFSTRVGYNTIDTGSNYSCMRFYGNGSTVAANEQTNLDFYTANITVGSSGSNSIIDFINYSNSTTYKPALHRFNDAGAIVFAISSTWRNTSPINQIQIYSTNSVNFAIGTTFNLYGINASLSAQAKATGGNSIYTDGTYWYHIFQQSGTFTPSVALSNVDYLVVAGGGGGGISGGGGGGAGGLRCTVGATGGGGSLESKLSLSTQAYTVTVGAGGSGVASGAGLAGSNSTFSTITSTGGGGGGSNTGPTNGGNGGSGGGANSANTSGKGTGTPNQGFDGGNGGGSGGTAYAGGGGGAGQAGNTGGNGYGGNGVATSISGTSVTYAGGGGGYSNPLGATAPGGTGGGGTGYPNQNATSNLGGGGGAWNGSGTTSGNGGSGIVIIRYAV